MLDLPEAITYYNNMNDISLLQLEQDVLLEQIEMINADIYEQQKMIEQLERDIEMESF